MTSKSTAAAIQNARDMIREFTENAAVYRSETFVAEQVKFWKDSLAFYEQAAAREATLVAPPAPAKPAAPPSQYEADIRALSRQFARPGVSAARTRVEAKRYLAEEAGEPPQFDRNDLAVMTRDEVDAYLKTFNSIEAFEAAVVTANEASGLVEDVLDRWSPEAIDEAVRSEAARMGIDEKYLALSDEEKSRHNAAVRRAKTVVQTLQADRAEDVKKAQERNPNLTPEQVEAMVPSVEVRINATVPAEMRGYVQSELAASKAAAGTADPFAAWRSEPVGESSGFEAAAGDEA